MSKFDRWMQAMDAAGKITRPDVPCPVRFLTTEDEVLAVVRRLGVDVCIGAWAVAS